MLNDRFFFLTRSLDPLTISENKINTSSKKFELGFVKALSKKCDLEVVYIGKVLNNKNINKIDKDISYQCINHYSIFGSISLLKHITNKDRHLNNIVITSAYYPLLSFILLISRLFGAKVFSYIYDTHKSATENMKKVKKTFANLYFLFGFIMAKRFNGFLVLNDTFIKKMNIEISYLRTRIGIDINVNNLNNKFIEDSSTNEQKIICFAGTLNEDNGVRILLEAFKKDKNIEFELHFYGYGDLEKDILKLTKQDNRIKFFGNVSQDILQKKFLEADYLINLRDPDSISLDYAFPSKFIDYLATGTPVISNYFPAMDEIYKSCIIPIKSFSADSILESLVGLESMKPLPFTKSEVKEILQKNNNWDNIVDNILPFIKKECIT